MKKRSIWIIVALTVACGAAERQAAPAERERESAAVVKFIDDHDPTLGELEAVVRTLEFGDPAGDITAIPARESERAALEPWHRPEFPPVWSIPRAAVIDAAGQWWWENSRSALLRGWGADVSAPEMSFSGLTSVGFGDPITGGDCFVTLP